MATRSFLFVPGDRPDMLAKATKRGADALIVDLEDAVAPSAKEQARKTVGSWLASLEGHVPDIWVRVNHPSDTFEAEILAIATAVLTGVMIQGFHSMGTRAGGQPPRRRRNSEPTVRRFDLASADC